MAPQHCLSACYKLKNKIYLFYKVLFNFKQQLAYYKAAPRLVNLRPTEGKILRFTKSQRSGQVSSRPTRLKMNILFDTAGRW